MPDSSQMVVRQRILADFGELALRSEDLDEVLTEACRLVGEALGTGRSKILEIENEAQTLLVRAGVGWDPGIVGTLRMPIGERSSETFAIEAGQPVISNDISRDDRFEVPPFMHDAGVKALANVPILLPGGEPYGLLQVDDLVVREFDDEDTSFLRTYAAILGPIIDRLFKLHRLTATEERFRRIVESTRDYAIFLSDADDRITDWLPGAAAVFGWTPQEAIGRPGAMLFTEEDRALDIDKREIETARREGVAPNVRWHLRKDGSAVFIDGSVSALYERDGAISGFLKIGQDVTERRQREEQLRASEARFRQFGEASSDILWIRDAGTLQFEYVSPAFARIYGETLEVVSAAADTLQFWSDFVHPDDRDSALANIARVRDGHPVTHEFRIIRRPDGEVRWIENSDFPLVGEGGRVERIGGIAKDVTDSKVSAARLEVLLAELQHRSRNLIGVISSLATKTLGEKGSVADFQNRLKALSRAQALLSQFGSDTVEVGALARAELEVHTAVAPPKVDIGGPRINLTARQVQNYALALHELATNAVKYGALRDSAGTLSVHWSEEVDAGGRHRLVLNWQERGVELPPDRGARRGYGRELIENALAYALGARTEFEIGPDGVRCRIDLPLC